MIIGSGPFGPWHHEEMRAALEHRVSGSRGKFPVVPVLLPAAERPRDHDLPMFLKRMTWVEFQKGLDDEPAFHRLVCGIRGLLRRGPDRARMNPRPRWPGCVLCRLSRAFLMTAPSSIHYEVFLSHSSVDKPRVEELARRLKQAGIEPFLDKWNLIPGQPWQEALEEALAERRLRGDHRVRPVRTLAPRGDAGRAGASRQRQSGQVPGRPGAAPGGGTAAGP